MFKGGVVTKYSPEQLPEAVRTTTIARSPGGVRIMYLWNASTCHHFYTSGFNISIHLCTHLWTQNA